jgi:hypothetical protein
MVIQINLGSNEVRIEFGLAIASLDKQVAKQGDRWLNRTMGGYWLDRQMDVNLRGMVATILKPPVSLLDRPFLCLASPPPYPGPPASLS